MTQPLTSDERREALRLCEAATPGPWTFFPAARTLLPRYEATLAAVEAEYERLLYELQTTADSLRRSGDATIRRLAEGWQNFINRGRKVLSGSAGAQLLADLAAKDAEIERLGNALQTERQTREEWLLSSEDAMRLLRDAGCHPDQVRKLRTEIERLRPVVEAAEQWVKHVDSIGFDKVPAEHHELKVAVDAYTAAAGTGPDVE